MEVEGNTATSVQDASFLKKDAVVVDGKLNNAVVEKSVVTGPATATATETDNEIKKSEADCSSTMEEEKVFSEKDDLLEQIEEVCNDKVSIIENTAEDISKTSEHEFLKKIEEMENSDDKKTNEVLDEKTNNVAEELKAKNIIECGASTVDDVIVGDKVLNVKEEETGSKNATSSEEAKELRPMKTVEKPEENCDKLSSAGGTTPNKDATVSSSTTPKLENDLKTNKTLCKEASVSESKVESTATCVAENDIEKMDTVEEDKMEVDDAAAEVDVNNEVMEVEDAKETPLAALENVEMLSDENSLDNEAKSKPDIELNDVDMKESLAAKTTEKKEEKEKLLPEKSSSSDEAKSINSSSKVEQIKDEMKHKPEPEVATLVTNHQNDEIKVDSALATGTTASSSTTTTTKPAENKILLDLKSKAKENIVSSSLTNTPVSSSNVFNSTPIQKQFEISSENVSKISDAAELSHTEKEEEATSTKPLTKSFEDSTTTTESGTCATSETDQPSSDGTTKKYIDAIKKYNGMPDTTTDEEDTSTPAKNQKPNEKFEIKLSDLSGSDLKKDSTYEVSVCCEKNDVRYLSIERVDLSSNTNKSQTDKASASESSVQSSSNGSVTSLPAYTLPQTSDTPTSASTSSSTNCHSLITSQNKHTILGIEELCNFMINQFTKIKHAVNPESAKQTASSGLSTPTHQIKKNKKNSPSAETPSTSASKSKRARKRSMHEDDAESTPKTKQAKRDISKETPKGGDDAADSEDSKAGPCVLAKWVDKKFYAGKITGEKPGSKFVVLFEDGASKTLPKESIVFGEGDTLPLQDQQVYALVEEDYESGIVMSIEKSNNKVYYNVKTENTTVKVTASDIYLEVDQAKEIQKIHNVKVTENVEEEESFGTRPSRNKRPPASPSTPEAGYSGAVGKRGGKRQKRLPFNSAQQKQAADDSDDSDALESTPASPKEKVGLELVEGVQPELQNSANDSELARMIFISDYKKSQPNCDVDELLGPLPKTNALFRNKPFLLTCTVGLRPHRYEQEKAESIENNRFKQFSEVPYIKRYLQKQLEAGGAKVYNYFEDVPKNKYKQCKLIAPRPCITAKYVQCLSSDIQAISHDWVIDSCRQNKLVDVSKYQLPAGWSILAETFVEWKIGKNNYLRNNAQPFAKTFVLIAGEHSDFVELWGRVCKAAGAKLRLIKSLDDITRTTKGYMVAESDFSHAIKAKAQHYGIPVVSTVWIVQSLIMGAICPPNSHPRLTQLFEDEEI